MTRDFKITTLVARSVMLERDSKLTTARERREVALRRNTSGNPDSVAKAVVFHRLEGGAAIRAGASVGCTGDYKWRAHVEVTELGRAGLSLRLSHWGLNHQRDESQHQCGLGGSGNK